MAQSLHLGTRKGLFRVEKSQGKWQITNTEFLSDNVSIVTPIPHNQSIFAALDHGHFGVKLHRSRDNGNSWEEIATPTYPPKPESAEDKDMWGKELPWKLVLIWSLVPGHPSRPNSLWCGTIPGGLFHSKDNGDNWTLIDSLWNHPSRKSWFGGGKDLPGIHSICVHPKEPDELGIAVSCGGYWVSKDNGRTWDCRSSGMFAEYMPPKKRDQSEVQDPHLVVRCQEQPLHLWSQHHNGIFRSTNGGETWSEVKNSLASTFGFAVAVHPQDPNTAWFIPAIKDEKRIPQDGKVIVTRTRDGGESFEVLTTGLPQEHAYDIVYRHALDVDESGQMLAFASTTGNCWISENQGDSWQLLSSTLPPVYCVRWG